MGLVACRELQIFNLREFLFQALLTVTCRPSWDLPALLLTAVLGLTNGVFGSLPIILAPARVKVSCYWLITTLLSCDWSRR